MKRKRTKKKLHWDENIDDSHRWAFRFEVMARNHVEDDRVIHPRLGCVTQMMKLMNCPLVLDGVDHAAGAPLVNFSIVIRCHSVIRNARLCRIMNVISKNAQLFCAQQKIASVQMYKWYTRNLQQSRSLFWGRNILVKLDSFRFNLSSLWSLQYTVLMYINAIWSQQTAFV